MKPTQVKVRVNTVMVLRSHFTVSVQKMHFLSLYNV